MVISLTVMQWVFIFRPTWHHMVGRDIAKAAKGIKILEKITKGKGGGKQEEEHKILVQYLKGDDGLVSTLGLDSEFRYDIPARKIVIYLNDKEFKSYVIDDIQTTREKERLGRESTMEIEFKNGNKVEFKVRELKANAAAAEIMTWKNLDSSFLGTATKVIGSDLITKTVESGKKIASSITSSIKSKKAATFICPDCKHKMDIDAKFCSECGYKVPKEFKCVKCGSINFGNFCTECGQTNP